MRFALQTTAALFALSCAGAHAGFITIGGTAAGADGLVSSVAHACTVTFNGRNADNACGAVYTAKATNFPIGSTSAHAAPAGDSTAYLAVGPSDGPMVSVKLGRAANYFGFMSGSLDYYNLVRFYLGDALVDQFSGTDINMVAFKKAPTGDQRAAAYVNYFPTLSGAQALYDRVVFTSSQNAFETDNHAFGVAALSIQQEIPEPNSGALLAIAALGLLAPWWRRRR